MLDHIKLCIIYKCHNNTENHTKSNNSQYSKKKFQLYSVKIAHKNDNIPWQLPPFIRKLSIAMSPRMSGPRDASINIYKITVNVNMIHNNNLSQRIFNYTFTTLIAIRQHRYHTNGCQ